METNLSNNNNNAKTWPDISHLLPWGTQRRLAIKYSKPISHVNLVVRGFAVNAVIYEDALQIVEDNRAKIEHASALRQRAAELVNQ